MDYSSTAELFIEFVHSPGVEENDPDKGNDRTLLGEPEAEIGTADRMPASMGRSRMAKPKDTKPRQSGIKVIRRTFAFQYAAALLLSSAIVKLSTCC
jgi:hypothetical protein